jgi:hypothetical protein
MPKCILKSNRFPGIAHGSSYYPTDIALALDDGEVAHLQKLIAPLGRDFDLIVDSAPGTDGESLALLDAAIARCRNIDTLRHEIGLLPRSLRAAFASRLHKHGDVNASLKFQAQQVLQEFEDCHGDSVSVVRQGNSATANNYL